MEKSNRPLILGAIVIGAILIIALVLMFTRSGDESVTETVDENNTSENQENGENGQQPETPILPVDKTTLESYDCDAETETLNALHAEYKVSEFEARLNELEGDAVSLTLPQEYYNELAELEKEYDIVGKDTESASSEVWASQIALLNKYNADVDFVNSMNELFAEYKIAEYAEKYAELCDPLR